MVKDIYARIDRWLDGVMAEQGGQTEKRIDGKTDRQTD